MMTFKRQKPCSKSESFFIPMLIGQTTSNRTLSGTVEPIKFKDARRKPANSKRPSEKAVKKFLENYVKTKKEAGEEPRKCEAEELGMQNGIRRSQVREVFPSVNGAKVRRGRPRILRK